MASTKICPSCGKNLKDGEKFLQSFCIECFLNKSPLFKENALPEMVQCQKCEKTRLYGAWEPYSHKTILRWALAKLKPEFEISSAKIVFHEKKGLHGKKIYDAEIDAHFEVDGHPVHKVIIIPFKIEKTQCEECSLRSGGYFEAVIQLRGDVAKIEPAAKKIAALIEAKKSSISKIKELKEGLDLYVASKRAAHNAINDLKFGFNSSQTLAGKKDGKDLYRVTYCVRL